MSDESMDAILDFTRHGELSPVDAVKLLPGHEAVKIVAPLLVTIGAVGKSTNSMGLHGVVVFFMSLDVLSILNTTVFGVIYLSTGDDSARAERLGYAKPMTEGI
jgi:hypothetical protein